MSLACWPNNTFASEQSKLKFQIREREGCRWGPNNV